MWAAVLLAAAAAAVATADSDVTATLKARMVTKLDDFPCVRVVSATANGDIGCSSECRGCGRARARDTAWAL